MCTFGTLADDNEDTDSVYKAVATAFEFKKAISDMNAERMKHKKESISIGVGVNTGMEFSLFAFYYDF